MARRPEGPWWREARGQYYATIAGRQWPLGKDQEGAWRRYHELMAGEADRVEAASGAPTVRRLCGLLLDHTRANLDPETFKFYERHLRSFVDACGELAAPDLRPHHVTAWVESHGWGQSTRSGAIGAVKRVFRWSKRQGFIDANPVADLERPAIKARERIMDGGQFRAILATTKDRAWRDLLEALWETGCRPSELTGATAADVDLAGSTLRVRNKTRRHKGPTRTVYLSPSGLELLARLCRDRPRGPLFLNTRGRPWTRNAMACRFRAIRERLGYGGEATAYALRHLYATDALEREVPIATVAELMGHADTTMVSKVYSKLRHRTAHLRDAAGKVRPAASSAPTPAAGRSSRAKGPGSPSREGGG